MGARTTVAPQPTTLWTAVALKKRSAPQPVLDQNQLMPLSCTWAPLALQMWVPQTFRRPLVETADEAGAAALGAAESCESPPHAASAARQRSERNVLRSVMAGSPGLERCSDDDTGERRPARQRWPGVQDVGDAGPSEPNPHGERCGDHPSAARSRGSRWRGADGPSGTMCGVSRECGPIAAQTFAIARTSNQTFAAGRPAPAARAALRRAAERWSPGPPAAARPAPRRARAPRRP